MHPVTDRANSLAAHPGFSEGFDALVESPAFWLRVDFASIVEMIDQIGIAESGRDSEDYQQWLAIRQALGIDGLKQLSLTAGFHEGQWQSEMFVEAPAPRSGLLAVMLSTDGISEQALASIPESATIAGGIQIDVAKIYAWFYDMAGQMDPDAQMQIDQGLKQASQMMGVDVKTAFIDGLGSDWVYYVDPNVGGNGIAGAVVRNQLRDPQAGAVIERILMMGNMFMQQQFQRENIHLAIKPFKYGDHNVHYLNSPLITPALTVDDDQLLIGLYPQTVASALDLQQSAAHRSPTTHEFQSRSATISRSERTSPPSTMSIRSARSTPRTPPP